MFPIILRLRRAAVPLLVGGQLLSCSSSTEPSADDGTAPAAIQDLSVASVTASTVTLTWTATGDDGDEGTATRYEIRRADQFIAGANWDMATPVPGVPAPQPAGSTETFTVAGLNAESHWFFALTAFDEEGNSFGCSNCVEAICFDDVELTIADANLEAAIRSQLALPTGPLHRSDLRSLTELDAEEQDIASLAGLEECVNLVFLRLYGNRLTDLSPLNQLTLLWDLGVADNEIVSLAPLAGLPALAHLWADQNAIADLSPLAGLTTLTALRLEDNTIGDLTPLTDLTALEWIALANNDVTSVAPLSGLTNLTQLTLHGNAITDAAPLANLTALERLTLSDNPVGSLAAVAGMTQLDALEAFNSGVSDVTPLAGLTALRALFLTNNAIVDASSLAELTALETLMIGGNQLTNIVFVTNLTALSTLYVYANQIVDLAPVAGLTQLEYLHASYNQITDLAPLVANAGLGADDTVNVEHNPLTQIALDEQIPALQARGVTVAY